jgi:hypothetical protein
MAPEAIALPFTDRPPSLVVALGVAVAGTLFGILGY